MTTESGVDVQRGESVKASQLVPCFAGRLKGEGPCASGRAKVQRGVDTWEQASCWPAGLQSVQEASPQQMGWEKDTRHKKNLGKSLRRA